MNVIQSIFIAAKSSGATDWDKLDQKLQKVGSSTKSFVDLVQNYWYIPMFIALIIIAILVFAGGREGRVQAKSKLGYFLIGTAIIMMLPSAVGLVLDLVGRDKATTWSYTSGG